MRPPAYPSAEDFKMPENPTAPPYAQSAAYPNIDFSPSYRNLEPQPLNTYPNYPTQPNFSYPAFENVGGHNANNFEGVGNYRPQAAPYKPIAPETKDENYCLICAELILGTDMLVLSCLHKFHHQCLKSNMSPTCLVPGCGHLITAQEKAAILSKVTPNNVAKCRICMNLINDVRKDAATHCLKVTSKMHKDCFIMDVEKQTNGMFLLTKGEAAKFRVMCPICGCEVNEDAVKKNLLPEKYKVYKAERDKREKEDKKKLDYEKKAKIKPKCCGMELNKNEFMTVLEAQGIQNAVIITSNPIKRNLSFWICPLCGRAFPKNTLKEIYTQEPGLKVLKNYCGSCGKMISPEIPVPVKCNHNMCGYCSSSQLPCTFCQKIK
jgi:hypothetical protein